MTNNNLDHFHWQNCFARSVTFFAGPYFVSIYAVFFPLNSGKTQCQCQPMPTPCSLFQVEVFCFFLPLCNNVFLSFPTFDQFKRKTPRFFYSPDKTVLLSNQEATREIIVIKQNPTLRSSTTVFSPNKIPCWYPIS